MRRRSILVVTVVLFLFCSLGLGVQSDSSVANSANGPAASQLAGATFPRLIKFTGGVRDLTGKVPTGVVGLTFSLYELPEGGSPLWTESQSLPLDSLGRYTALLGASSPGGLPLDLFTTGKTLWLGVQPQLSGQVEQPRVLLVAVPYALKASDSDTLGGRPASAYALAGSQTLVVPAAPSTITAQPGSQPVSTPAITSSPETACAAVTSDGTATANTVAKFTAACNVENSLIRDNGTGVAVGGTSAPGALLDVQYTSTGTSGSLLGHRVLSTFNPAATSSASNIGAISDAQTATGNTQNFTGYLTAMDFTVNHYGKGTLAAEYGVIGYAVNSAAGTISKAVGAYTSLENVSTGTITNGYGVYVNSPANSGGGTFSNYTGVYIANPSAVTGAYGLYSAGGLNYFGGNVGIGTATPGAALEVKGTAKFDMPMTFASGQSFPGTLTGVTTGGGLTASSGAVSLLTTCSTGQVLAWSGTAWACVTVAGTGTVTKVSSGAGLTGGPITTTGTLSIATAGVTNAMLANPSLTVTAGTGLSGGGAVALGSSVTLNNTGTLSVGVSAPITTTGGQSPTLGIASAGVTDALLANSYSGTGTCTTGSFVSKLARNAAPTCAAGNLGTVTSVGSGTGLTGGPITTTGTLSIATGGVSDTMLANAYSGVGTCATGKVVMALARNGAPSCVAVTTGTVTSVGSGAGLTGGPITGSGTLSIATGGVTNTMLADSSLTVGTPAGSGLSGGGLVALGGSLPLSLITSCASGQLLKWVSSAWTCAADLNSGGTITGVSAGTDLTGGGTSGVVTLNLDTTKVPQLVASNSFTGDQSVTGNLNLTDSAVGDTAITALAADVSAANTGISGAANGPSGTGVLGDAEGTAAIGVWGMSSTGYAGEFTGNLDVTGAITAGTKDFKIDDPSDPANKYMYHASVESSEMLNVYSGNVTLDDKGEATVQVPSWLETLNGDFRYQLTCIGGFAPVYIAEEIGHGQFKVAGGKPGMKVSWQVTGVRQDAFAKAHPLQVEVEKPANERGYYVHPELYGAGKEKSILWANHPEQMRRLAEQQAKAAEPNRQ